MRIAFLLTSVWRIPAFYWVALALRLLWCVVVGVEPVSDGAMYSDFAHRIASGLGYTYPTGDLTAYWAVGASAMYGAVSFIFGSTDTPAVALNVLLGMGVVYFTYNIAKRYFGGGVAVIAGWLVAMWPVLIQFTTVYASELPFIFFLLAALYVWGAERLNVIARSISWGGLLCIATYIRPTALPLFFVLPAVHFFSTRDFSGAVKSAVMAIFTAALLFSPWVMRNQQVFGVPILVSANFGSNLWMGNNPQSNGGYMPLPSIKFENEVKRDLYFKNQAIEFIKNHPDEYVKLAVRRLFITYDRETIGVAWNEPAITKVGGNRALPVLKVVSTLYWWMIALTAMFGIGWAMWSHTIKMIAPLLLVMGFFFIVPVLTVGQDRYHMPLDPFLAIFSAFALRSIWRHFRDEAGPTKTCQ